MLLSEIERDFSTITRGVSSISFPSEAIRRASVRIAT
jgi:hypothetical protein